MSIYEGNEKYIFVSYAHRDTKLVLPIITALQDNGFRIWYDNGIEAGTEWPESIAEHIENCAVALLFISENALESQNCRREINFAISEGREILAIYLSDVKMTSGMKMQLGTVQAMFYNRFNSMESFMLSLCETRLLQPCRSGYTKGVGEKTAAKKTAAPKATQKKNTDTESDGGFSMANASYQLNVSDDTNLDELSKEINECAEKIIDILSSFKINASITGVDRGPRITRYELTLAPNVSVRKIINIEDDIALNLRVSGVRIVAPIPGKSAVGIEVPNKQADLVRFSEIIASEEYKSMTSDTAVCIGVDVAGNPIFGDVKKFPHLLLCGTTGMGKSVFLHTMILSILEKAKPEEVKLLLIDPKKVEFLSYSAMPHLYMPIVTEAREAVGTLYFLLDEVQRRFELLLSNGMRSIDQYNSAQKANPAIGPYMPRLVVVIDELADLMMFSRKHVEECIMQLAQKARAAGIHLILATQRPRTDVITGVIKANIPTRICFAVASQVDSRIALDTSGAEKLLGRGDMLYLTNVLSSPIRVQGAYVSDKEIKEAVDLKFWLFGSARYDAKASAAAEEAAERIFGPKNDENARVGMLHDLKFRNAVEIVINEKACSASLLQRRMSIGYAKAAKYIDAMEEIGIVGPHDGAKPRKVLFDMTQWLLFLKSVDG